MTGLAQYHHPVLEVFGVPFDLCGRHHGSRLGPLALRLAGLVDGLEEIIGPGTVQDGGDAIPVDGRFGMERTEADRLLVEMLAALKARVAASLALGNVPLVLGGDHTVSIGSVSAALEAFGDRLGLLWIDAHADCNTPATSESGNIHGMPVAALCGDEGTCQRDWPWRASLDALWPQLLKFSGSARLKPAHVAWIGLRDVDLGEAEFIARAQGSFVATMHDVDSIGLGPMLDSFWEWAAHSGIEHIWVSFDVDSLDPIYAPGTGTAVRGGFSYREGHLIAETLYEGFRSQAGPRLAGLDLVEVNPLRDQSNSTAHVAYEWLRSFFGETILHSKRLSR